MNTCASRLNFRILCLLLIFCAAPLPLRAAPPLVAGQPIRVGTADGLGPLTLPAISHYPRGCAFVTGAPQPDLFVRGTVGPDAGLYLYPFNRTLADGSPVFGQPVKLTAPLVDRGTIFQAPDQTIHGVFVERNQLIDTRFDPRNNQFTESARISLEGLPRPPGGVTLLLNPDGSAEALFQITEVVRQALDRTDSRKPDYQPYDGAGRWRGSVFYSSVYAAGLPGLLSGPLRNPRLATPTPREIRSEYYQAAIVNLGPGRERDILCGSLLGEFKLYRNRSASGVDLEPGLLLAGQDGNTLRHPTVNAHPISYPNPQTGLTDLIVGGEGSLYRYSFTGRWTPDGRPVFNDPQPVLQESAPLYAGSLAIPHVADWDADGRLDILSGNSEGRILFFKNTGSNEAPAFLNGEPLRLADGRPIHIQPGYGQDIQGPNEARWGYTGPTVIDWNEDGTLDILLCDSTAQYTVFINRGTPAQPKIDPAHPIYCDGLNVYGMWRVKPGAAKMGQRMAYVLIDDDGEFHLYWRLDDYNVLDAGKLTLQDGSPIGTTGVEGGATGRIKINLHDWDRDGRVDLIVGTARLNAIPNPQNGWPYARWFKLPSLVLFMKNVGTNEAPVFKYPVPFRFRGDLLVPGGNHECGPAVADLGPLGDGPNLIAGNEHGRFIFYPRQDLTWE